MEKAVRRGRKVHTKGARSVQGEEEGNGLGYKVEQLQVGRKVQKGA